MPNDPVLQGDMLEILKTYEDDTFDLVFCSPPYEDLRLYGELGYSLTGQDWVDWSVE
jgi:DNA modification methylase